MRKLPPLYALRAFEAAARHLSFSRAADELALTQSAVSRHIRTLEEHFDCQLFVRQGRQVSLSAAGELLLPGLSRGFDALEHSCAQLKHNAKVIRLKAPPSLTIRWLLPVMAGFRQQYPEYDVQLTSSWMHSDYVDFHSEPFDGAVLLQNSAPPPGVQVTELFAEWLLPVARPQLVGEKPWQLEDLQAAALLHPTHDRRDWRLWLDGMGLLGKVDLNGGQAFDTIDLAMEAAALGYGVAIGDLTMLAEDTACGRVALPWPVAVASGARYVLMLPGELANQPALKALAEYLATQAQHQRLPEVERLERCGARD
ncbi:LysR substrate-binding domain-containing protein [Atopomonas hussainii]|uniref:LysR substrate-binding domain-containing protein n=1 Tax=Atopomonas hussainii TaxID=1429083 RepID=UPI0009002469|nr:LysR substrate-binding domain-containing protein [Atopomonas hussainii]